MSLNLRRKSTEKKSMCLERHCIGEKGYASVSLGLAIAVFVDVYVLCMNMYMFMQVHV